MFLLLSSPLGKLEVFYKSQKHLGDSYKPHQHVLRKRIKYFSIYSAPEDVTITDHFEILFEETSVREKGIFIVAPLSSKSSILKTISIHRFSITSGLKSVSEKLCFYVGVFWAV